MIPHFHYDPVRGRLEVRIEIARSPQGDRLFMTREQRENDDIIQREMMSIHSGEEPPLYTSLSDQELLEIVLRHARQ